MYLAPSNVQGSDWGQSFAMPHNVCNGVNGLFNHIHPMLTKCQAVSSELQCSGEQRQVLPCLVELLVSWEDS